MPTWSSLNCRNTKKIIKWPADEVLDAFAPPSEEEKKKEEENKSTGGASNTHSGSDNASSPYDVPERNKRRREEDSTSARHSVGSRSILNESVDEIFECPVCSAPVPSRELEKH